MLKDRKISEDEGGGGAPARTVIGENGAGLGCARLRQPDAAGHIRHEGPRPRFSNRKLPLSDSIASPPRGNVAIWGRFRFARVVSLDRRRFPAEFACLIDRGILVRGCDV